VNDLNDVLKIIDEHYTRVGDWMQAQQSKCKTTQDCTEVFREAERRFTEGLNRLNKLQLSRDDRRHFSLLRGGFKLAIKSTHLGARGRYDRANDKIIEASLLMAKYNTRMTAHVARRGG
jgi:hypothetical protein